MKELFPKLFAIDVSDYVDRKVVGGVELDYLRWACAVKEFTENVDEWDYIDPYWEYEEPLGYMVHTQITVKKGGDEISRSMWLPVMDGNNKAMKKERYTYKTKYGEKTVEPATMNDINKTIMRCMVKNMSIFGLGLSLYGALDTTEPEEDEDQKNEVVDDGEPATKKQLEVIGNMDIRVIANVLKHFEIESINQLSKVQASEVISRFLKKSNGQG